MRRLPFLAPIAFVACALQATGTGPATDAGKPTTLPDAATIEDAPDTDSASDVITADAKACDQDGDGWISTACLGKDCCDSDPEVFPGGPDFHTAPSKCKTWDYNCDGKDETQYGYDTSCKSGIVSCTGYYVDVVTACGDPATLYDCFWLAGCWANKKSVVQGCR